MNIYLLNCYFIDINGLIDIILHNSFKQFIPINYNYISYFFFEDSSLHSNILEQFYLYQRIKVI
jgi:hypothetical protein